MKSPADLRLGDSSWSEPVFAATIYNQGQHDRLLDEVIRPFWLLCEESGVQASLWTMRFGARGEHLKLRIHGSTDLVPTISAHLEPSLDDFVASIAESGQTGEETQPLGSFPAVDLEDAEPGLGTGWRPTEFLPSPFVLGGQPLVEDTDFVAAFARVQSAMSTLVMVEVAPRYLETGFLGVRQTFAVRALLSAFAALPFEPDRQIAYLKYHRDWLARFIATRSHFPESRIPEILEPLDRKVDRAEKTKRALAQSLEMAIVEPRFVDWTERLRELHDHSLGYRDDPRFDLDPYADDTSFLPLFKSLQGSTNQIGLAIGSEIWAYHLLLAAAEFRAGPTLEPVSAEVA